MRISDWSSDVCSSDLEVQQRNNRLAGLLHVHERAHQVRAEILVPWVPDQRPGVLRAGPGLTVVIAAIVVVGGLGLLRLLTDSDAIGFEEFLVDRAQLLVAG